MRTAMPNVTCGRITELRAVGDRRIDLDAAIHRPRMHDDRVGLRERELVRRSGRSA